MGGAWRGILVWWAESEAVGGAWGGGQGLERSLGRWAEPGEEPGVVGGGWGGALRVGRAWGGARGGGQSLENSLG